jgi:hypothetical protein
MPGWRASLGRIWKVGCTADAGRRRQRGAGTGQFRRNTGKITYCRSPHRYNPGRGIYAGLCGSVGTAPTGDAPARCRRGSGPGYLPRRCPGGDGGRSAGPAHDLGCSASPRTGIQSWRLSRRSQGCEERAGWASSPAAEPRPRVVTVSLGPGLPEAESGCDPIAEQFRFGKPHQPIRAHSAWADEVA